MEVLKGRAKDEDIILLSDVDEIMSLEGFLQYNPEIHPWACTELRHYYWYFNRASVFDYEGRKELINFWYGGTKVVTYRAMVNDFDSDMLWFRMKKGCNGNLVSKVIQMNGLKCDGPLLVDAGWHFSYVLNDEDLVKKVRSIAEGKLTNEVVDF